jgi:tetratricopeptide (TPR) repeat protein
MHAAKIASPTLALAAMLWAAGMPLCAAAPTGAAANDDAIAKQFADALGSSNSQDPQSPDTLNARLGFAEFLAKSEEGDCRKRLGNAHDQLDIARASQAGIALPFALAREAAVDYQIHAARASCGGSTFSRDPELRAAVESALHAVSLYRDEFDAVSMVTMQFNVGAAYHELGEEASAVAALQTALNMDREYGFRDDANDNYRTLLQWSGQPAGPEEVAALMKDFPQRSTTLAFGWFDGKADLTLTLEFEQLSEGGRLSMHGTKAAERRVRPRAKGWSVSFAPLTTSYEISQWPDDGSLTQGIVVSLTRMALQFHDFDVARAGDFAQSIAAHEFDSNLRSDAKAVTEFLARNNASSRLTKQIRRESAKYGSSKNGYPVEALVAEAYNIETSAWIGASLEQGVWYDMSAPLSLPLAPGLFVTHQIEFAFTRQVPCTADSTDEACVEIVVRATPDPEVLRRVLMNLSQMLKLSKNTVQGEKVALQSSTATYLRLVLEPTTLQFWESDIRRYGYWTTTGPDPDHPVMVYERTHAVVGPIAGAKCVGGHPAPSRVHRSPWPN